VRVRFVSAHQRDGTLLRNLELAIARESMESMLPFVPQ
jgi:hypothetical protein